MTDAELRRLAEAATPGEWFPDRTDLDRFDPVCGHYTTPGDPVIIAKAGDRFKLIATVPRDDGDPETGGPNSVYIAAAHPQTVLGLLDEIERLRGELAAMRAGHGILGSIRGEIK